MHIELYFGFLRHFTSQSWGMAQSPRSCVSSLGYRPESVPWQGAYSLTVSEHCKHAILWHTWACFSDLFQSHRMLHVLHYFVTDFPL